MMNIISEIGGWMKLKLILLSISAILFVAVGAAHAQLSASHVVGDMGLQVGSQGPPGVYVIYFLYNYDFSTIVGPNGEELTAQNGDISAWAQVFGGSIVTTKKILGGTYGASAFFLPFQNVSIEAPRIDFDTDTGFAIADMWIQPIQIGWHKKKADFITWYAFYAPTGSYSPGANDNHGYGMWSHELALGTTLYFDEKRSIHAASLASFEFHSKKKDSDAKAGTVLTLEGGVGTTYKQFLTLGAAYYAQWKLTDDSGLDVRPIVQDRLGKNRNFAIGPEVGFILPLSKDLKKLMILSFRYEFETSARLDTKGNIVAFTAAFKIL
jgi:hypothetical protein